MKNCTYGVGLSSDDFDPTLFGAGIHVDHFESCVLRKQYAYDDQEATEVSWHRYLHNILSRLTVTQIGRHLANGTFTLSRLEVEGPLRELREMDLGNENYGCPILGHCRVTGKQFEYPEGWQFFDHLIPEMYEKWSKKYLHVSGSS